MLSRAAATLHDVGRQMERADHLSRLLDVHHGLWLERAASAPAYWSGFMEVAGWPPGERTSTRAATEAVLSGHGGPSIKGCLERARRGALALRTSLSSEVYEQLNTLYWLLAESDAAPDLHGFLSGVERGVQLFFGLVEDTMAHDDAWDFIRLGKHFERAVGVTRLVVRKRAELAASGDDPVAWAAVLRCCNSFEAYRKRYSAPITPDRVSGFLLLNRDLPRSARYCVAHSMRSVARIDGQGQRSRPQRLLGQLSSLFEYTEEAELADDPRSFETTFNRLARSVEDALMTTYFQPSRVRSETAAPVAWRESGQQQQQ